MHGTILPTAEAITTRDVADVDGSYTTDVSATHLYAVVSGLCGIVLTAAILAANLLLDRRFRRRVAPGLAVAAALVLAVATAAAHTFAGEADTYRTAKADAFDSINALTHARALSDDANAYESIWMLDPAETNEDAFFRDVLQVANPQDVTASQVSADSASYYAAVGSFAQRLGSGASPTSYPTGLGGSLGTELSNVTFPGEGQAAVATVKAFALYVHDDGVIRTDADDGDLTAAVLFDVGVTSPQSNYAFARYDDALNSVIALNQKAFDTAVAQGDASLDAWDWLPFALAVLLPSMVALALAPRLREYR
jgi:hypothetical protein